MSDFESGEAGWLSRRIGGLRLGLAELRFKGAVVFHFVRTRYFVRNSSRQNLDSAQFKGLRRHLRKLDKSSRYVREARTAAAVKADEQSGLGVGEASSVAHLLKGFPVMDKASMMAEFNVLNTAGLDRETALAIAITSEKNRDFASDYNGYSVGLSSGTSGHRGLFVVSRQERAQWAGTVLALTLPRGKKLLGHRIALFLRAGNQLYDSVASRAVAFKYFDIYRSHEHNMAELLEFSPTILVAPPSVLREIAESLSKTSSTLSPHKVFSVAEVLEPLDREFLERAFSQDVIHQIYQCTEGLLGVSCELGTMHLNEDAAVFEREYLSERRFVPIVTDFRRTTQPIIRYRLNDVLVEAETECPCGSKALALHAIEGREDDTLEFLAADGTRVIAYADMVSRAMTYAVGVKEYRVVQSAPTTLTIYLENDHAYERDHVQAHVDAELNRLFGTLGLHNITASFEPYQRPERAKLRRIERAIAP